MKKYLRLSCTVCKRTVDKLVDNLRALPDRCTITLSCQGRLQPVEYRTDAQIASSPAIGITDWFPRGGVVVTPLTATEPAFIDTSSGQLQQLVLAIKLGAEPPLGSTALLTLQVRADVPKDFKSFIYRRDSEFSAISGVEDGVGQKTLQFRAWGPDPDLVEVYLNGVKLQVGTGPSDYQLDDGTPTPPAPSNTIRFNSPILPNGVFQVEVIVSKSPPVTTRELTFNRNGDGSRLELGAWENVTRIERFSEVFGSQSFYLFTFDVKNNPVLTRNTIMFPSGLVFVDTGSEVLQVGLSDCLFLLSRAPHTKVDRYPDININLADLDAARDYLKYATVDGQLALTIAKTALSTSFPPAVVYKFIQEGTIKTPVPGETEQLTVDGTTVVGPDT